MLGSNRKPLLTVTVFSLLAILLLFFLCRCEKKQEKELKIGAIIPLTVPFASYGEPVRDGMFLAVDEINRAGGIKGRVLKLIIEDDAGDPKSAVNAFNKLASSDKNPDNFRDLFHQDVAWQPPPLPRSRERSFNFRHWLVYRH